MVPNLKRIIIAIVAILGFLLIVLSKIGLGAPSNVAKLPVEQSNARNLQTNQSQQIEVVSTNPSPLEGATILPTQEIEINFSQPAVNEPYLYAKIDPLVDFNIKLSDDRKGVKIWPKSSYQLGQGYTLTIPGMARFDGGKTLGHDLLFHFKTIEYNGV